MTHQKWCIVQQNTKTKHNIDAKYGFYKYKTWFAVKDKHGKYIEYYATLVIRRDADRKSYLYDITEIKKVGALKLASTSQGSHGHVGGNPPQSNPTNKSVSQTPQNATKKSLKVELSEDSLGRKLSEAQIIYFKDSKVRDENGALKPVYHGTKADFSVFDVSKNKVITFGNGFYFGENKDAVNSYYAGDNGKVMETYVNITNPFIIQQSQLKDIDSVPRVIEEILGVDGITKENIKETLESYGYDGIHYKNSQKGNDVYVVYDSKQIKDVDNTNPTTNPDIHLSLDVDLMSILEEEYSKEENDSASIIEEGFS